MSVKAYLSNPEMIRTKFTKMALVFRYDERLFFEASEMQSYHLYYSKIFLALILFLSSY